MPCKQLECNNTNLRAEWPISILDLWRILMKMLNLVEEMVGNLKVNLCSQREVGGSNWKGDGQDLIGV